MFISLTNELIWISYCRLYVAPGAYIACRIYDLQYTCPSYYTDATRKAVCTPCRYDDDDLLLFADNVSVGDAFDEDEDDKNFRLLF